MSHLAKLRSRQIWKMPLFLFIFLVLVFVVWLAGIFKRPAHFRTVQIIDDNEISQYLTNEILPEFYNKSQSGSEFEMTFSQEGINDILARHIKELRINPDVFSDISITFKKGRILLAALTSWHSYKFIVTAVFKPSVNEEGLTAGLSKIQTGTSTVPFAKEIIRRRVLYELARSSRESDLVHYAGIVLNDKLMPREFSFNHRDFRIKNIEVEDGKLIIGFVPK